MKKYFLFISILLINLSIFAKSNTTIDYEQLAEAGSIDEVKTAFKENKVLALQVFGQERETFLMLTLKNDRDIAIIRLCIENDSNIKAKSKTKKTPLMYASQFSSNPDVIDLLVKTNTLMNRTRRERVLQKDEEGKNSFDYARLNPNYSIYQRLLTYAEDPAGLYEHQEKIEEIVAEPEKTQEEIEEEAKQEEIKQYSSIFLLDYAEEETPAVVKMEEPLIENPNAADKNGVTLLMKAAKAGNDWDVELLLKSGADVNLRDKDDWTALMYAARYQNNLSIMNMLIENGAYTRVRNKFNATPLLMASHYSQNPEIVSLLLKNRTNSEDEVYRAFIFAITGISVSDHIRAAKVEQFIKMQLPLNRLWKGQTPLMYACQYGKSTEVIKQLLDAGADASMKDENGKTAFDYAKNNKNLEHNDIYWMLNGAN